MDVTLREAPLTFNTALDEKNGERHHDTLRLMPYAEALRDFIEECDTPITIGIQGAWGIGKTSLMNMLRGSGDGGQSGLLDQRICKVVNFQAWSYSQFNRDENLAIAALQALISGLGKVLENEPRVDRETLRTHLDRACERLCKAKTAIHAYAGAAVDTSQANEMDSGDDVSANMIAFRHEFQQMVKLWSGDNENRKVVIFIDDLDRIRPSRTMELLEAVKNFVDVDGCVFVLAVDYEVVQQGMAETLGREVQKTHGKALYDKLIQLPFVMPATSYRLDEFIISLLQECGFPGADTLKDDVGAAEYFVNITLCTVGRNPRAIKRVMTYAKLLERIRDRSLGKALNAKNAKILYALICNQIAWPELFNHFVNDPTVDTITSLQSWEYLDTLPDARPIFERAVDDLDVKNDISTFFDTLFALLDENDDGQLDTKELEPVLDVMSLVRMTSVEDHERPREFFVRRVHENTVGQSNLVDSFLENVFKKSVWYLNSECKYRKSGSRYVTLVHDRKQIGSLVSLKSQPFLFRLAMPPGKVSEGLRQYWDSKHKVRHEAITLARNKFGSEASLIGFGETVVDFSKMTHIPSKDAIGLLNALFRIVTGDVPEKASSKKK
jgi:hypothetical protein